MKEYILDDADYRTISKTNTKNAGSKARRDLEYFLSDAKPAYCTVTRTNKFKNIRHLLRVKQKIKKGMIIVQYPLYIGDFYKKMITPMFKNHGVAFIHDLECLRLYKKQPEFIKQEFEELNQYSKIVVHNEKMKQWLLDNGCTRPMICLDIFDYQTESEVVSEDKMPTTNPYQISFAGNLSMEKSPFIYKLDELKNQDIMWHLFGVGYEEKNSSNKIKYEGAFEPQNIPKILCHSHFGLVWDGGSLNACKGIMGEYQQYNNPHKCSLYLSVGVPIIVWQQAAMADFVEKNKVGICIHSLEELEEKLSKLNKEDYAVLKKNAVEMSEKIRSGYFTNAAIKKVKG